MRRFLWIFDIGIRTMNEGRTAGWIPHMFVFCAVAVGFYMFGHGLPPAPALLAAAIADAWVTFHATRVSVKRLRKLGLNAMLRPRGLIEAASLSLTLSLSMFLFVLHDALAPAWPWQQQVISITLSLAVPAMAAFYVLTLAAWGLGIASNRPVRGRSVELVNGYFWTTMFVLGCNLLPDMPNANMIAFVVGSFGVAILAILIAISGLKVKVPLRQ